MWLHIIVFVSDAKNNWVKSILQPRALPYLSMAIHCTCLERQSQHSLTKHATVKMFPLHTLNPASIASVWHLVHDMKLEVEKDIPCAGSTPPCANMVSLTISTAGFLASSIAIGAPGENNLVRAWIWNCFLLMSAPVKPAVIAVSCIAPSVTYLQPSGLSAWQKYLMRLSNQEDLYISKVKVICHPKSTAPLLRSPQVCKLFRCRPMSFATTYHTLQMMPGPGRYSVTKIRIGVLLLQIVCNWLKYIEVYL